MAESNSSSRTSEKKRSRVQSGPLKHLPPSSKPSKASTDVVKAETVHEMEEGVASSCQLTFTEVKGDLFSCPPRASLAHCVSEDMAMGKGIATLFKRKFGGVGELKAQGKE